MLDDSGHVIEGTMSNIFAIKNKQLLTPLLRFSGVNGVIREQILSIAHEIGIDIDITDIEKSDLSDMDEIFVCNSIIGIWPVKNIDTKTCHVGPLTLKLAKALQQVIQNQ